MGESYEKIGLIPREAVKIMSGFSEDVAIAVTHPLWPGREPRKRKDSAISRKGAGCREDQGIILMTRDVTATVTVAA